MTWLGFLSVVTPFSPNALLHHVGSFWAFVTPFLLPATFIPYLFPVRLCVWHLYKIFQHCLLNSDWDFSLESLFFCFIHWIQFMSCPSMPFGPSSSDWPTIFSVARCYRWFPCPWHVLCPGTRPLPVSLLFPCWSLLQRPETTQDNVSMVSPKTNYCIKSRE